MYLGANVYADEFQRQVDDGVEEMLVIPLPDVVGQGSEEAVDQVDGYFPAPTLNTTPAFHRPLSPMYVPPSTRAPPTFRPTHFVNGT